MYDLIIKIMENDMGFLIFDKCEGDIDIREYVIDSIQFIEFIINIENKLNVELSDDFLYYELLSSAKGLSNKLTEYIENM